MWKTVLAVPRRSDSRKPITAGGPAVLFSVIGTWIVLLISGWPTVLAAGHAPAERRSWMTVLDAPEHLDDDTVRLVVRQADGERVERTYQTGTVVQEDPHNRQRGVPGERQ